MMRSWTSKTVVGSVAVAIVATAMFVGAADESSTPARAEEKVSNTSASTVERGKYLVAITGCSDCHTPMVMGKNGPEPDVTRMLSGHPQHMTMPPLKLDKTGPWVWAGAGTNTAFTGPWGTTYAINLTPDQHTGIGIWTETIFVNALRRGKHWGEARPIMPPMPWQALSNMTDDDLKAVYAYLRTVAPVTNMVPDYEPPAKEPTAK